MRPQTVRAVNDREPTAVMGVIRGAIGGVNLFRVPRPWPGGIWNAGTRDLRPYFAPRVPRHALLRTSGATARDPKKINCRPLSLRGGGGRCSCAAASLRQRLPLRGLRSLRSLRPLPTSSASSLRDNLLPSGPPPMRFRGWKRLSEAGRCPTASPPRLFPPSHGYFLQTNMSIFRIISLSYNQ